MTGKCRNGGHRGRIPRIPLTGTLFLISYGSAWVALTSSDPSSPPSGSAKTATPTSSAALHLVVLHSQEVADPHSFDGGGGGGHGPHRGQDGRSAESILALIEAPREQESLLEKYL